MNLKWNKGLQPKEKEVLKADLIQAKPAFNRLKVLLEEELENSVMEASKRDCYMLPAWSEYQADRLGEQRALRKFINFLEE